MCCIESGVRWVWIRYMNFDFSANILRQQPFTDVLIWRLEWKIGVEGNMIMVTLVYWSLEIKISFRFLFRQEGRKKEKKFLFYYFLL